MTTLGSRIRAARREKGLTQEELGRQAGIQKSAVAKYENGRIETANSEVILRFAQALGTTKDYLLCALLRDLEEQGVTVTEEEGGVLLKDDLSGGSVRYDGSTWRRLQEENDFRAVWSAIQSAGPLPHAQYREVLQESGIRLLLDADAKVSPEDLEDIVEFIKFKQRKNGR